jgi:hypothetical protein
MPGDGVPDLSVIREAVEASRDGRIDLVPIWTALGRPRGRSPRQWRRHGYFPGAPSDPAMAFIGEAHCYAAFAAGESGAQVSRMIIEGLRRDPARHLMDCPNLIMAYAVTGAVRVGTGATEAQVKRSLLTAVAERSAGEGVYGQETRVAEIQRLFDMM